MLLLEINRTYDISLFILLQIYITTSTTMSFQNSPDMFLMDLGDGMDDIAMNLSPEEPPDIANLTPSQQSGTPVTPHVWSATSLHNVSANAFNCSADGYSLFPSQRSYQSSQLNNDPIADFITPSPTDVFSSTLEDALTDLGPAKTAQVILQNKQLKDHILNIIVSEAQNELQSSVKASIMTKSHKNREYLLQVTPTVLCQEMMQNCPLVFKIILSFLNIEDYDTILNNHGHNQNVVAMIFSLIANVINRKATGYALVLTTMARHGGMREDSIKLLCCLCHPRTSQKYDKEVLAKDWDVALKKTLALELSSFQEASQNSDHPVVPQLQLVWDNINLKTKHRFERKNDDYNKNHLGKASKNDVHNFEMCLLNYPISTSPRTQ